MGGGEVPRDLVLLGGELDAVEDGLELEPQSLLRTNKRAAEGHRARRGFRSCNGNFRVNREAKQRLEFFPEGALPSQVSNHSLVDLPLRTAKRAPSPNAGRTAWS